MSIANKLEYLQETKNQIKNAITEKGVTISDTDTFRSYADKIASISTGTGTSSDDWQPEPDWWDIEKIIEEDTEDYSQKIICLLTDELDDGATDNFVQNATKYKLSDGQIINSSGGKVSINNVFDTTKDKECSKGYKTRYITYYSNSNFNTNLSLPNNTVYAIFSGVKFSGKPFQNKRFLQAIKFINNSEYINSNISSMFSNCTNLQLIQGLDTSNITNASGMFNSCYNLGKVPSLNTSKVTNMNNMFNNCNNLKEVLSLDTSEVTDMSSMFYNCSSLKKIPSLDTSKVTNINYIFYSCVNLKEIPSLDANNMVNTNNIFNNCQTLINIQNISNIKASISFSGSTYLNHSTLLRILNALVDLTDQTTQTLTLGSINLAKLTDEEKAIATEKNWTLA